jgi:hypothetical protein
MIPKSNRRIGDTLQMNTFILVGIMVNILLDVGLQRVCEFVVLEATAVAPPPPPLPIVRRVAAAAAEDEEGVVLLLLLLLLVRSERPIVVSLRGRIIGLICVGNGVWRVVVLLSQPVSLTMLSLEREREVDRVGSVCTNELS